ncbi:MAG: enolase [Candidatus Aenigmarchaeota archaeon]|nr:enolase [Candidatus Aenigmarchaeota archaeon]
MIRNVKIYPVFNSKGEETIKVKVRTIKHFYTASIPSGTSKGRHEAKELPFKKIFELFPKIRSDIVGLDETDWITNDKVLEQTDGTKNFSKIGVNLALGISLAVARAASDGELWRLEGPKRRFRFPYPLGNVIGGGQHGGYSTFQEFLVLPHRAKDPVEATKTNLEAWKTIGEELGKKKVLLGRNIENAWMCKLDELKTLNLLSEIAEDFNLKIGIDVAASSFWDGKKYLYKDKVYNSADQLEFLLQLAKMFKLYYIEDPFHEDDFEGFAELNKQLKNTLVVGDDLYCTNPERIMNGIQSKSTNSAMIKPNQIGTLYQVQKVIDLLMENNLVPVASHRSGETEDDWIADISIMWNIPIIKIGNLGPDLPKHNRLAELWGDIPHNEMAKLP